MSRYTIAAHPPYHHCVVGFDPPLGTFFAQVYRAPTARRQPRLVRWLGTEVHELPTLTALTAALAPYATVPDDLHQRLAHEQTAIGFRPNFGTRLLQRLRDTAPQHVDNVITVCDHTRTMTSTSSDRTQVGSGADADDARGDATGRRRGSC